MECADCLTIPCECEREDIRREMLTTVLDLMQAKVLAYKDLMQNRVFMIKEDIISTIAEETVKFQSIVNSSISKLNSIVAKLQENEEEFEMTPEIIEAMTFQLDFNLDSASIQSGFNKALVGEFVIFRELLKGNNTMLNTEELE